MAPPTGPLNLDVQAISGICGSISIAAWVVVFSPQIIENFRRSSADGLSVQFIIVWLLGDVFNILGAVFQGVLPTMLILAVYYTIADFVLLAQLFYYRGLTWRDDPVPPPPSSSSSSKPTNGCHDDRDRRRRRSGLENGHHENGRAAAGDEPTERTGLLGDQPRNPAERRGSDWSHLNPTVPMTSEAPTTPPPPPPTRLQAFLWNLVAVLMVIAAGVLGWFLSRRYSGRPSEPNTPGEGGGLPSFDVWGQVFGWLCAVLYLGSRFPQLLLNWRRRSTEGVSILFFLFACLGNLTYVLSIFAYDPDCGGGGGSHHHHRSCRPGEARRAYARYILVNLSWLAGSLGTLLLDLGIFAQFFIYSSRDDLASSEEGDEEYGDDGAAAEDEEDSAYDHRPLLQRVDSDQEA
ncbi:PQ-loop-domain-containing protein [Xylariaceae sp. FL0804]|nr:PQ-loop-domain-containing protein [Xylariaceae sp. FL0804]